jgi:putative aldouronate transport system permease protein
LAGVDQSLYEAASIDGAGRIKQLVHITFPSLVPIIAIQLIMRIGQMMSMGAEKTILLYSPAVYSTADTIASYVYRSGIQEQAYSLATAVGMFNSIINLGLVFFANWYSRKYVKESLW